MYVCIYIYVIYIHVRKKSTLVRANAHCLLLNQLKQSENAPKRFNNPHYSMSSPRLSQTCIQNIDQYWAISFLSLSLSLSLRILYPARIQTRIFHILWIQIYQTHIFRMYWDFNTFLNCHGITLSQGLKWITSQTFIPLPELLTCQDLRSCGGKSIGCQSPHQIYGSWYPKQPV